MHGDPTCPVESFKFYLGKLRPELDALWQCPLDSFLDGNGAWYSKAALGRNTLASMMPDISRVAGLSQRYTNHCIRATSIQTLDRAGFEARHITRITGHKSESSIKEMRHIEMPKATPQKSICHFLAVFC